MLCCSPRRHALAPKLVGKYSPRLPKLGVLENTHTQSDLPPSARHKTAFSRGDHTKDIPDTRHGKVPAEDNLPAARSTMQSALRVFISSRHFLTACK